ncbi:hypothetical protein BASA81_006103 [Batrachochytrium salamandrivorans]|nr:hypothetical protein BASA81_006103 [Batrachochytrium salamandrivorans]
MQFETVRTFHPSLEEMQDFDKYLLYLHEVHHCEVQGLTKIVPPAEWGWKPTMAEARKMWVRHPIEQCVTGRSGSYNVYNVVKPDLLLHEYEALALAQPNSPGEDEFTDLFQVERKFWKSLTTTSAPPFYGSDVEGTLFGNADVAFNVNTLECCLKQSGVKIPGVTNPMMYVGMWRSFFPFHTEDVNMFSISVNHLGKPKFWYGIPPEQTSRVQSLAKGNWPNEASKCSEMMRHKTMLFSPTRLEQAGISFCRAVQRQGEIIVTWPSCFHGGFNTGLNVAEAVNFCPKSLVGLFLSSAKLAGFCKCRPDSVVINVDWLEKKLLSKATETAAAATKDQSQEWIQCEDCSKWRKIPAGLEKQQDERWTCALNTWNPTLANCQAEQEEDVEEEEGGYPPKESLRAKPLKVKVGDWVDLLGDGDVWLAMRVDAIVDGFARLHEVNTLSKDDSWIDLRNERVVLPGKRPKAPKPPKRVKLEPSAAAPVSSSSSAEAKEYAQKRRDEVRALVTQHIAQVREIFTTQVPKHPSLECIRPPKQQWQLPPHSMEKKLPGICGLRTAEQAFEVTFRSVILSQKLLGLPFSSFRDPRDASEVHHRLVAYFSNL